MHGTHERAIFELGKTQIRVARKDWGISYVVGGISGAVLAVIVLFSGLLFTVLVITGLSLSAFY